MRAPDFFVIGAMKAGTTTLYHYLCRHPQICMAYPKEPQFFSRPERFALGYEWYQSLFDHGKEGQLWGEASTCYSRWPHFGDVPARIAAAAPDARLIYALRHPVERTYSHYAHYVVQDRRWFRNFEEAMEAEPEIIDASLYMTQIEQFMHRFDRTQLLCLTLDELTLDPTGTLDRIQGFLQISHADLTSAGAVAANRRFQRPVEQPISRTLRFLRNAPGIRVLVDQLPPKVRHRLRDKASAAILASPLSKLFQKRHKRRVAPLNEGTRAALLDRFREPTRQLERFLGRDLSAWCQ